MYADNLRVKTEYVHRAFGPLRGATASSKNGWSVVIGILRIGCDGHGRHLRVHGCDGEIVRPRGLPIDAERVLTAQYGRRFVGWFLLLPLARIRLVLRRSKAGRQRSQEEDSGPQPACPLLQIQV